MFHQPDLFDFGSPSATTPQRRCAPRLSDLVSRVSSVTRRPRYALLVLDLIAREADTRGRLGPYVQTEEGRVPVRDWLCGALAPLGNRDCRRRAMIDSVRSRIIARSPQGRDPGEIERECDEEIRLRIIRSGRTSISRAVSDLVKAGLLQRHYQGYRVDHHNRGAQREAVYAITAEARSALRRY